MSDLTANLRQHIDVLAELIGERNTLRPSALEATRAYLRRELTAMGHVVHEQPFETHARPALTTTPRPSRRCSRSRGSSPASN